MLMMKLLIKPFDCFFSESFKKVNYFDTQDSQEKEK